MLYCSRKQNQVNKIDSVKNIVTNQGRLKSADESYIVQTKVVNKCPSKVQTLSVKSKTFTSLFFLVFPSRIYVFCIFTFLAFFCIFCVFLAFFVFFSIFFNFLKKIQIFFLEIFQNFFLQNFSRIFGENFKSLAQKLTKLLDWYAFRTLTTSSSTTPRDYTVQTLELKLSVRVWTKAEIY